MKKLISMISLATLLSGCSYFFPENKKTSPEENQQAAIPHRYEDLRPTGETKLNSWFLPTGDGRQIVVRYSCHSLAPERISAEVDVYAAGTPQSEMFKSTSTVHPLESYRCKGVTRRHRDRFAPRECEGTAVGEGMSKQDLYRLVTEYPVRE